MDPQQVYKKFKSLFNGEPLLVRSPGRVNLIGEHTDYNEGFVLPAATDKALIFAVAPSGSNNCNIIANDLNDSVKFQIDSLVKSDKGWPNYLLGVVQQIKENNFQLGGFNCVFGGDIPIGAGLSSSAALECGLAFGLNELFNLRIEKQALARIAQKAEHQFVGVRCGIMDQFANLFGMKNAVMKLDCSSLEFEHFLFDFADITIVLCDTQISHSLAASQYNERRRQCEQGVNFLRDFYPHIQSLRDVTLEMLAEKESQMAPEIHKRCEYVVRENDRVIAACEALRSGDLESFGNKMFESHAGLRDDYEVSCPELDFLVEFATDEDAVLGARLMGGGFGGCTINLVKKDALKDFTEKIQVEFKSTFGTELNIYIIHFEFGTALIRA